MGQGQLAKKVTPTRSESADVGVTVLADTLWRHRLVDARAGGAGEGVEQLVLELRIADGGVRVGPTLVMAVAAGGAGLGVIPCRKPVLRPVAAAEAVGRARPRRVRGHPA